MRNARFAWARLGNGKLKDYRYLKFLVKKNEMRHAERIAKRLGLTLKENRDIIYAVSNDEIPFVSFVYNDTVIIGWLLKIKRSGAPTFKDRKIRHAGS